MDGTTLKELHDEFQALKIQFTHLETRIIAVERTAENNRKDTQEQVTAMGKQLGEVNNKLSNLESLEDANFMAVTHMLGVIARKLKIPARDLKTGDRRGTGR